MNRNIIAIDFGTTNTYVSLGKEDSTQVTPLQLEGKTPQFTTALLYKDKKDTNPDVFPLIGSEAENTFGESAPDEIAEYQYRYRAIFKPDIADSDDARQCAIDFLKALLRDARKKSLPFNPKNCLVIFGVPCEANEAWRRALKQIAKEAEYGEIELIEESTGALISDLKHGQFNIADIMLGHLVVDFGGGTCDFTYFRNGKVEHAWGDMSLGGRLLDDLFYQWFAEQHPDSARELESKGYDFYVLTLACRELKEWFSGAITANPDFVGKKKIELPLAHCYLQGLCREDFQRRLENYMPSQTFRNIAKKMGQNLPEKLLGNKPVNLNAWFQDCLTSGLKAKNLSFRDINAISLAGGSSSWYFVREYCQNTILGGDSKRMLQSPLPFAAISEGLAAYHGMKQQLEERKQGATNEKQKFLKTEIFAYVRTELDGWVKDIVEQDVLGDIFDNLVMPVIKDFREKGGTLGELQTAIQKAIDSRESAMKNRIEQKSQQLANRISETAFRKIKNWLHQFGLTIEDSYVPTVGTTNEKVIIPTGTFTATIERIVEAILITITAVIVANICGGAGMALLLAGPGGWIAGLILGAAAALGVIGIGKDVVMSWIQNNVSIPAIATYRVLLTDSAIKKLRNNTKEKMMVEITQIAIQRYTEIQQSLDKAIQEEINRLSIVNSIL
jgi:molecular chaperone DnaK (HSP70)